MSDRSFFLALRPPARWGGGSAGLRCECIVRIRGSPLIEMNDACTHLSRPRSIVSRHYSALRAPLRTPQAQAGEEVHEEDEEEEPQVNRPCCTIVSVLPRRRASVACRRARTARLSIALANVLKHSAMYPAPFNHPAHARGEGGAQAAQVQPLARRQVRSPHVCRMVR